MRCCLSGPGRKCLPPRTFSSALTCPGIASPTLQTGKLRPSQGKGHDRCGTGNDPPSLCLVLSPLPIRTPDTGLRTHLVQYVLHYANLPLDPLPSPQPGLTVFASSRVILAACLCCQHPGTPSSRQILEHIHTHKRKQMHTHSYVHIHTCTASCRLFHICALVGARKHRGSPPSALASSFEAWSHPGPRPHIFSARPEDRKP